MPTYKNTKDHPISWGARTWTPGEEKPVSFFIPDAPGLVKISNDPAPAPQVLLSQDVDLTGGVPLDVLVPSPVGDLYDLSVIAIAGVGEVSIMGGDPIRLDEHADYVGRIPWGRAPKLTLSSALGGTFRVLAEEVE